mmetsp:Transcript_7982/g.16016  ORF Transcript_7982/g.16016 Transcript_7982/m.16016 type:complete len:330 (+) Transcript_7982:50-1039(+)
MLLENYRGSGVCATHCDKIAGQLALPSQLALDILQAFVHGVALLDDGADGVDPRLAKRRQLAANQLLRACGARAHPVGLGDFGLAAELHRRIRLLETLPHLVVGRDVRARHEVTATRLRNSRGLDMRERDVANVAVRKHLVHQVARRHRLHDEHRHAVGARAARRTHHQRRVDRDEVEAVEIGELARRLVLLNLAAAVRLVVLVREAAIGIERRRPVVPGERLAVLRPLLTRALPRLGAAERPDGAVRRREHRTLHARGAIDGAQHVVSPTDRRLDEVLLDVVHCKVEHGRCVHHVVAAGDALVVRAFNKQIGFVEYELALPDRLRGVV